jgi:tripartite-type tricarboxylate transporter receptor subunit TctC
MTSRQRAAATSVGLWLLMWAVACSGTAARYPHKPITIVSAFTAGGAGDVAARTLAAIAPRYVGQSVVVVNRPGAGGVIGTSFVNGAQADGYTLLMTRTGSQVMIPAVDRSTPYAWDDFTFLGLHEVNPFVFAVSADSPYRTLADLAAALKSQPGRLSYATSGPATLLHFGPQILFQSLGLPPDAAVMVPFQGGAETATAVIGRHVDFVGNNLSDIFNQIKNAQVRALAVTTPDRVPMIPDVPTVRELGYPELEQVIGWSALVGPPGLPQDVVATWREALPRIAADPEWQKLVANTGSSPDVRSPEDTRTFLQEQFTLYAGLAQRLNLVQQ